jgi:hypothetical protein
MNTQQNKWESKLREHCFYMEILTDITTQN